MSAGPEQSTQLAERPFRIADWRVDPAEGRITCGNEATKLEPQVMAVLVHLAERAGKVVTRQVLESEVWAGRVVSYDALSGTIQKLRRALRDDARNPRIIETLSKRGFRLVAPVLPIDDDPKQVAWVPERPSRGSTSLGVKRGQITALLLALLALVALAVWWGTRQPSKDASGERQIAASIAVLPFVNLSDDPAQDYFSDGITDDLITSLSKDSALLVISRDSSFLYKGEARDLREVADRLHVRYILSGSVRREGQHLRLNAQLADTETGASVWAEHYDGARDDVFALQDEIADRIASALAGRLGTGRHPSAEKRQAASPDAYDYFLHGRNRFFRYANKAENQQARELYRKALELDPDFGLAYAMLAWTHAFDAMNGWSGSPDDSLQTALELSGKAIALDETLPVAYFVSGLAYRERGEYAKALAEAEKAIALDPNYANAHVLLATLHYYTGRPEKGLELIRKAMRLNPHHPFNYPFHLGQAYFVLGRYAEAIEAFEQGLQTNPGSERLHVWLAAAYAQSGRIDDAAWEAEQVVALNSEFSLERIGQAFPFQNPADRERFLDGLRKAGFSDEGR